MAWDAMAGQGARLQMKTSYRVVIKGVDPNHSVAGVAAALAPAFKVPKEQMIAFLQAPQFVVKRGLDLSSAARYEDALGKGGCVCLVEPERELQEQECSVSKEPTVRPGPSAPGAVQITASASPTATSVPQASHADGPWSSLSGVGARPPCG